MIRVAVIGVGYMGSLHVQKWCQQPGVQLVGIYDSDAARLQQAAQMYGVRAFQSVEEACAAADAVTIATPSYTHAEVTRQALEAGCHCLVEKPLASSLEDAQQLVQMARERSLVLMAGHIERFNPAFVWVRQQRVQPRFVEVHRLHPFRPRAVDVSVVLDVMIHDLDLLVVLLGCPVQRVEAHGVAVLTATPDIANARVVFANGCVANVTASRVSAKFLRKMRLFQPFSYIALDFAEHTVEELRLLTAPSALGEDEELVVDWIADDGIRRSITRRLLRLPAEDALREEQRAFLRAIQGEEQTGIEQALETLRVVQAIEQQLRNLGSTR